MVDKKNTILIDSISKDMDLFLPRLNKKGKYLDDNRKLFYKINDDKIDINAGFKKYEDKVYSLYYGKNNFWFRGMTDFNIYDILIEKNAFKITTLSCDNGESCIKKIGFSKRGKKSVVSLENIYPDNSKKNEFRKIEDNNGILKYIDNEDIIETSSDSRKSKLILKSLLETEEYSIKDSFDLINNSIPKFFDQIKYDYKILNKFNDLYENDKLYSEDIMNSFVLNKK